MLECRYSLFAIRAKEWDFYYHMIHEVCAPTRWIQAFPIQQRRGVTYSWRPEAQNDGKVRPHSKKKESAESDREGRKSSQSHLTKTTFIFYWQRAKTAASVQLLPARCSLRSITSAIGVNGLDRGNSPNMASEWYDEIDAMTHIFAY